MNNIHLVLFVVTVFASPATPSTLLSMLDKSYSISSATSSTRTSPASSTLTSAASTPASSPRNHRETDEERVNKVVKKFAKDICEKTEKTSGKTDDCEKRAIKMIKEGQNDELFYWMWEPTSDGAGIKFETPIWWSGFGPWDKESLLKKAREMKAYTDMDSKFNYFYKKNFDGFRIENTLATSPMMEFYEVLNPLKNETFVKIKENFNSVRSSMFTASAINFLKKNSKNNVIALLNKGTDEKDERNLQRSFFFKNEIPTIQSDTTFKPKWKFWNVKSNDEDIRQVLGTAIKEEFTIHQFDSNKFFEEIQDNLRRHEENEAQKQQKQ